MGGGYSYAKPQGFLNSDPRDEPVYESVNSGSMATGAASPGFATTVAICRAAITGKSPADHLYDEQENQKNDQIIGEIMNKEANWYEPATWWNDPAKEDFGKVVRREFATKVVPYVRDHLTDWEGALNKYGTQFCKGPLVIEKVGLALLFGLASDQIRNLEGAAAAIIFLGSGSKKAEALTAEQLKALQRSLVPESSPVPRPSPR